MARYVTVRMLVEDMSPLSWKTFALIEGKADCRCSNISMIKNNGRVLENKYKSSCRR